MTNHFCHIHHSSRTLFLPHHHPSIPTTYRSEIMQLRTINVTIYECPFCGYTTPCLDKFKTGERRYLADGTGGSYDAEVLVCPRCKKDVTG